MNAVLFTKIGNYCSRGRESRKEGSLKSKINSLVLATLGFPLDLWQTVGEAGVLERGQACILRQ